MQRTALLLKTFLILFTLSACGPQSVPQSLPTAAPSAEPFILSPTPDILAPTEVIPESLDDIAYNEDIFASVENCQICHKGLVDAEGNDVANIGDWSSSIMAHAAVDPYYLATVSAEIARHPELQAAIEDKCATCHMPMAHFAVHAAGGTSTIFGENGYKNLEHPLHEMANEAISCTVCHQIKDENFGDESSFSGELIFDTSTAKNERVLYGPYPAEKPYADVMQSGSGYIIEQSDHLAQSEMCATCHTLHTHYLTAEGELSESTFPEQTPYLEWLASDYAEQQSCQDCHMPKAKSEVAISIMGSPPRSPFYLHTFTGGNAYMLEILKKFSGEIDVQSNAENFDEAIQRTKDLLEQDTATLSIESAEIVDSQLDVRVALKSLTGHKFPSGFPSRRAWLHINVLDADGNIIFESGSYESNGKITGNANDEDDTLYEPHYAEITAPEQVQIYENIMQDTQGNVTTALLLAQTYKKDNRLLPSGFDKDTASAEIAVYGEAIKDGDFIGAEDIIHYGIKLDAASAPLTIKVELLYQSIGYRWAQNLGQEESPQIDDFLRYYDETPNIPIIIASDEIKTDP